MKGVHNMKGFNIPSFLLTVAAVIVGLWLAKRFGIA
jgi:hypothetical protein